MKVFNSSIFSQDRYNLKILSMLALALTISAIHFLTFEQQAPALFFMHTLLTKLYFLPVLLAAFWKGKRGAIYLSLFVTVIFIPHVVFHVDNSRELIFENISEIILLWVVGIIGGILSEKLKSSQFEKNRLAAVRDVSKILGGINHEIMIDYEACLGLTKALEGKSSTENGNSLTASILAERLEHLGAHLGNLQQLVLPKALSRKRYNLVRIVKKSAMEIENVNSSIELENSPKNEKIFLYLDVKRMQFALTSIIQSLLNGDDSIEKIKITIRKKLVYSKIYLHLQSKGNHEIKKWNHFELYADPKRGYLFTLALSEIRSHGGRFEIEGTGEKSITLCLSIPITPGVLL